MSKIVPSAKIGVPAPLTLPPDSKLLVAYYGPKGFTPSYDQAERIAQDLSTVVHQNVNGTDCFVFDTSLLPALAEGNYDLYFTLADAVGNEGDFSEGVDVPLDRNPPPKLGQPIVVG